MSASLSGQQMLGRPGQMLAVLCGCVKYSGKKMSRMHTRMLAGITEKMMAETAEAARAFHTQSVWLWAHSGCFTLGTVPDVKFHSIAFPWPKKKKLNPSCCHVSAAQTKVDRGRCLFIYFLTKQMWTNSLLLAPKTRSNDIIQNEAMIFLNICPIGADAKSCLVHTKKIWPLGKWNSSFPTPRESSVYKLMYSSWAGRYTEFPVFAQCVKCHWLLKCLL